MKIEIEIANNYFEKMNLLELIELRKLTEREILDILRKKHIPIYICDISKRTYNNLLFNNIFYINQLCNFSIKEFSKLKNVGSSTIVECTELLHANKLNWKL